MKNDYVQASLRHSRFLFVYSAKHATFFFAVCALYLTVYEILMFMGLICVIILRVI